MKRLAWRRIAACLIDYACALVWAGIVAAVAFPLYISGLIRQSDLLAENMVASLVLVIPVIIFFASFEAGRHRATLGKRLLRIRLSRRGPLNFGVAVVRNVLKVALPWIIGHAAVYGIVTWSPAGHIPTWVVALTFAAYILPIVYLVSLFVRKGRTPYDVVTRITVKHFDAPDWG